MTVYPSIQEVLNIHRLLIAAFGGAPGVRDHSAIESALGRLSSGYYDDTIAEAAALWDSLSQNHPFVDGHKRVAMTVALAFLRLNGYRVEFRDQETYEFLIGLYDTGTFCFLELDRWLRSHVNSSGQGSLAPADE